MVGIINESNIDSYAALILPDVVEAINDGANLLAIGCTMDTPAESIAAGALVGGIKGGVFEILSFYVAPEYSDMGFARDILDYLIFLVKYDVNEITASLTMVNEGHDRLHGFLEHVGFKVSYDLDGYYLFEQDVMKNIKIPKGQTKKAITIYSRLDKGGQGMLKKKLQKADRFLPEDVLESPALDRDLTLAYETVGEIEAFIAVEKISDAMLMLSYVFSNASNPISVLALLGAAVTIAEKKYSQGYSLLIQPINKASFELMKGILHTAKPVSASYSMLIDKS